MRTGAAITLGIGLIMLLVALALAGNVFWFRTHAIRVTGTVIDVPLTALPDGNAYCPVIRFTTREGQSVDYYSNVCSWPPAYKQGQQVVIYYDRADPERVQFVNFFGTWFLPLLFGFLGILFTFSGVSMFSSKFGLSRLLNRIKSGPPSSL